MTQQPTREYVLGTNESERHRLGFQHRLWSAAASRLWDRAGAGPGSSVLDVGCGPGFASLDLAQLVTRSGRVVGVDESAPYIEFAGAQARSRGLTQASFFEGDAASIDEVLAREGVGHGSFDIAYIRWVMCFVPDPGAVIASVSRLLAPGGRLCVQDYMNYRSMCTAPRTDAFDAVIEAVGRSWRDQGGDPDIMSRLPRIAIDHGLSIEHLARVEIGTARPGSQMWSWPSSFWPVFLPRLESLGYISAAQHRKFREDWAALGQDPAAFMHLPPVYEMIATKPA